MKNSRILILLLAVLMIVSISAVSATEDIADDADLSVSDDSTSLKVEESVDDIQAEDESDKLDDPVDTGNNFTSLQSLIDAEEEELTLEKDYARVDGDKDIQINKNFTVDGKGKYTIDAKKLGGIFNVSDGNTLTLKNLTLINANATHGGAILNINGEILVYDCKFINNTAAMGGAIGTAGPSTIVNSQFEKNNATCGGAIYIYSNHTVIEGCTFSENLVDRINSNGQPLGGAIMAEKDSKVKISNSLFTRNDAKAQYGVGGAILSSGDIEIDNCNFTNNIAQIGGAISSGIQERDGVVNVTKCIFENNHAVMMGGAIASFNSTHVSGSKFINNSAVAAGGAIAATKEASINDSSFDNNTADQGGAIIFDEGNNFRVSDSNFTNNKANTTGGAISLGTDAKTTVEGSTFYGNTAKNGSAIYNDGNLTAFKNTCGENDTISSNTPIKKIESKVIISPIENVTYGKPVVVHYTIENRSSNVTVSVSRKNGELTFPVSDAVCIIDKDKVTVTNLTAGQYVINIVNNDDNNLVGSFDSAVFNVTRAVPTLDIKASYVNELGWIIINVTINKDIDQDIYFKIDNGDEKTAGIYEGFATCKAQDSYSKGTHNVTVSYPGDENYMEVSKNTTVELTKETPVITIINAAVNEYGAIVVNANITKVTSGKVTLLFIGKDTDKNWTVPIEIAENGTILYDELTPFEKSFYTVVIDYYGDDKYYGAHESTYVDVNKTAPILDVYSIAVNEFGHIVILANVTKDATGTVTFIFTANDKNSTVDVTIDNGTVKFDDVVDLGKGHYSINTIYNGDDNYYSSSESINETELTKDQISSTYEAVVTANQADITIKFPANATGNITVFYPSGYNESMPINGTVFISEIVENGPQYILVTYPGDKNYYGFNNYKIEFFVKTSSFISAKDVNVVYQNNGKVTVTLYDNNDGKGKNPIDNAEVVITLNGKTYKAKTNANGIATVTIAAKLVPKKYTATVSYAGTNITVEDKETFKFTVKKATPKLTAKKKTFKAKTKTKKYTIVLKDNKNKAIKKVKVYLKIGKKTYTAKTNSKGKAVFKIKKLTKRGTYKAKVTFKGNKYFNKLTKTAKIKVKR